MAVPRQTSITGDTAEGLAQSVEAAVDGGELKPGEPLPSVRSLADDLDVSPATVAAAYRLLRTRGLVVSRERQGVFVAARPPLPVGLWDPVPDGVRDLASGNPDPAFLPTLPDIRTDDAPRLYGEEPNLAALVEVAGRRLRSDGVDVDHVAVTSGAMDAIERLLRSHARTGDRVVVEDPGYPVLIDLLRANGLEPVGVPVDDRGIDPDRLEDVLDRAVSVVLTPRAQNPTGAALDERRAHDLAEVLRGHPAVLAIEDDHAGPVAGSLYRTVSANVERWAVVRSVSKWLGPDLRLAIVAGDGHSVRRLEGRQRLGPGWVSHILQRTVARLWADPATDSLLDRANDAYSRRRQALIDALAQRRVEATARSGLNVWVPVPEETPVVRRLQQDGWAVRGGETYRLASAPAIRITTAGLDTADAPGLAQALAEILRPAEKTKPA